MPEATTIILRVITKAGRLRISVQPYSSTLGDLRKQVASKLNVKSEEVVLAMDQQGSNLLLGDDRILKTWNLTEDGLELHAFTSTEPTVLPSAPLYIPPNTPTASGGGGGGGAATTSGGGPTTKTKGGQMYKTFEEYLEETDFNVNQLPLNQNYSSVRRNLNGPTPLPPAISLKYQAYRHVDHVEVMNVNALTDFVQRWRSSDMLHQKAAFLIGYYAPDPHYGPGGIRAVVEAIYQPSFTPLPPPPPPTTTTTTTTTTTRPPPPPTSYHYQNSREMPLSPTPPTPTPPLHEASFESNDHYNPMDFLNLKPHDELAIKVAKGLGFEIIGWVFTHLGRKTLITGRELVRMAKLQLKFLHRDLHYTKYPISSFVTLTISPKESLNGEAGSDAFAVTDLGLAMVRDNVLEDLDVLKGIAPNDFLNEDPLINIRKPSHQHELMPGVLESTKEVQNLDTDWLLVRLTESAPKHIRLLLTRQAFPPANITKPTFEDVKEFLKPTNLKPHEKLADFHFILFIAETLGYESAEQIIQAILTKTDIPSDFYTLLNSLA